MRRCSGGALLADRRWLVAVAILDPVAADVDRIGLDPRAELAAGVMVPAAARRLAALQSRGRKATIPTTGPGPRLHQRLGFRKIEEQGVDGLKEASPGDGTVARGRFETEKRMNLGDLTAGDFSSCLNQRFLIHLEGQAPLATELVEIRGLAPADDDPDRRRPFSLVFRGPPDAALRQGMFRVGNETLGTLDLFLVTIGPDKEGRLRHEAVFT